MAAVTWFDVRFSGAVRNDRPAGSTTSSHCRSAVLIASVSLARPSPTAPNKLEVTSQARQPFMSEAAASSMVDASTIPDSDLNH